MCSHAYSWERVAGENTRQRVVVGVGVGGDCGIRVGGGARPYVREGVDGQRARHSTCVTPDICYLRPERS